MQYTVLDDLDRTRRRAQSCASSPLNWNPPLLPAENRSYDASVVVVSFNTRELLRECLELVQREANGLRIEALIVDNNSSDGSADMVEKEFPNFRIIRSAVNLGFGAANNVAIQSARGRYLILLNSDAFLRAGALKLAVQHMDRQPQAALGGAHLLSHDSSFQPSARMFPNIVTDTFVLTGLAARFPKSQIFGYFDRTWADPSQPCQADWVTGAFSIIRADVLDKVGLFDPRFFLYGEEVDLCRRIKKAGYEIWYWPDISVLHIGGESSRQIKDLALSSSGSTQLVLWRMRSTLLYYRKHHGAMVWLAKWLELTLYHLSYLRNRFSRDPQRRLRCQKSRNLAILMKTAWKETRGGRISPPRPW
jgi:GT2 family glycosyltransferase